MSGTIPFRIEEAGSHDFEVLHELRTSVLENRLTDPSKITFSDYATYLEERGKGWKCMLDQKVVGFAIADLTDDNIWALFVKPGFEGLGIGRSLHATMLNWYFAQGKNSVWLSTEPNSRAAAFYTKAGWQPAGPYGKNEIKFTITSEEWKALQGLQH